MNKTSQIILNIIVGLVSLVFFIILLFPLDSMISHYLADIEKSTKGKEDWRISVSSIDASLFFDTEFKDLRLYQKGKEVFYAPTVNAGVSLLPLLSNSINLRFSAEYLTGEISGTVLISKRSEIDIEIEKVSLKELRFLTRVLKDYEIPTITSGIINGDVSFTWTKETKEGSVDLKISDVKMSSYPITALKMELPALVLSTRDNILEIDGALDKSQISINKFNIPGPDMTAKINGSLRLNRNNKVSRFDLEGQFSFSEKIKGLLDKIKETQPLFAPTITEIEGQKNQDGSYPLTVKGSQKKPIIKIGEFELPSM